jgi:hypothetical protein
MMRRSETPECLRASDAPVAPWAIERAMAIIRRHGFAVAHSTTEEDRVQATARLAYAIAEALNQIALDSSAR